MSDPASTSHAAPPLLIRWWHGRIEYPDAFHRFRPTSQFDMLRSMRTVYRLLSFCVIVIVVTFLGAVAGIPVPTWFPNLIGFAAVGIMLAATPPARYAALGLGLSSLRKKWSEEWLEADVPLTRLWTMLRSPVTVEQFAEYAAVLKDDPTACIDGGVDPRVVWALVERNMSVGMVKDYMAAGVTVEDAILLRESGVLPGDWLLVLDAGVVSTSGDERKNRLLLREGLRFVNWVRSSRASLHPHEFDTDHAAAMRSVPDALSTMEAWVTSARAPSVRLNLSEPATCTYATPPPISYQPLPCKRCGGTEASGHQRWFVNTPVGPRGAQKKTVAEWVESTGLLAPYFIAAGINLSEAKAMVASEECPDVDGLVFMAAWKD